MFKLLFKGACFLALIHGGMQLLIYGILSLFFPAALSSYDLEHYFFGEDFYPQEVLAFWPIFFLLALIFYVLDRWMLKKPGAPKWAYGPLMLGLDSLVTGLFPLLAYLGQGRLSLAIEVLSFNYGFMAYYTKLWLPIFLLVYVFRKKEIHVS